MSKMIIQKLTSKRDFDRVAENGPDFILHQTLVDPCIYIFFRVLYGKFPIGQRVACIQRRRYLLEHTHIHIHQFNISMKEIQIYYTIQSFILV